MSGPEDPRRFLPSLDVLLSSPRGTQGARRWGRSSLVEALREILNGLRDELELAEPGTSPLKPAEILSLAERRLASRAKPGLRPVLNGTGVVLHTNLERP